MNICKYVKSEEVLLDYIYLASNDRFKYFS